MICFTTQVQRENACENDKGMALDENPFIFSKSGKWKKWTSLPSPSLWTQNRKPNTIFQFSEPHSTNCAVSAAVAT